MGIEQAERLIVRHLEHHEVSVKFGRVRYYEHYGITDWAKNAVVSARIAELAVRAEKIAEQKFDATVERIAEEICRIAFCDPADLFDQDGRLRQNKDLPPHVRAAVASVETVRGGGIKVKLWNKNAALDSLGRWRRMFVELQERGKVGEFDHQTDDEVRADIEMLRIP